MTDDNDIDIWKELTALKTNQQVQQKDIDELKGDRKKVLVGFGLACGGILWGAIKGNLGL